MARSRVSPSADQVREQAPELAAGDRVDAGGGLVEEQDLGRVHQAARQRQLLLHAAGEAVRLPVAELGEAHPLEQQLAAGAPVLDAAQQGEELHVLVDASGRRRARSAAPGSRAGGAGPAGASRRPPRAPRRVPAEARSKPARRAQRGGLAGAVGADQPDHLAARHLQVQALDRHQRAVADDHVACGDHGRVTHQALTNAKLTPWTSAVNGPFASGPRLGAACRPDPPGPPRAPRGQALPALPWSRRALCNRGIGPRRSRHDSRTSESLGAAG